ncbi:MAG TPA: response regulator transcription factor [Candidatus Paceibacterota bacterium]
MKILIIEDDSHISEFIRIGLESEGFMVDTAYDGQDGSYKARINKYDIIILDYSLPIKNGFEVCDEIRSIGLSVPIIFLSVNGDTKKKIEALGKGADDYMTKPFSFDELKARIKALLRRPKKIENPIVKLGEITIDAEKQTAYRESLPIYLTRKEYGLLEYLVRNAGMVVSRTMIMDHVWSAENDPFSNTVEAHILNLRKKINVGDKKDIIRNIPGRGYIIDAV